MAGYLQSNKNGVYQIRNPLLGGAAGAVAKGQNQGGWNIRPQAGTPAVSPQVGTQQPIKYQGLDPNWRKNFPGMDANSGAAGYNGVPQQPSWVNQNGVMYGPNGQQMTPENYARMNGGGSSSFSSSYSAGGGAGYQAAFDSAKAANEARYNQLLTEGQATRDRTMGYLEGAGQTERADLEKGYSAKEGSLRSRMGDYGLGGTSIGDSLSSGLEQAKNRDTSALNERLQGQRLNIDNALSQQRAGVIERREDPYPSPEMAAASMSSSSSSYGGSAYGPTMTNAGQAGTQRPGQLAGSLANDPIYGIPTGVNLDYLTPAALNDQGYMDAFKRTNITKPPRLLTQRQYSS